jgi:hypothetical protein
MTPSVCLSTGSSGGCATQELRLHPSCNPISCHWFVSEMIYINKYGINLVLFHLSSFIYQCMCVREKETREHMKIRGRGIFMCKEKISNHCKLRSTRYLKQRKMTVKKNP